MVHFDFSGVHVFSQGPTSSGPSWTGHSVRLGKFRTFKFSMASKMIQYTQTSLKMLAIYIARLDSRHCLRNEFELDDHPMTKRSRSLPSPQAGKGFKGFDTSAKCKNSSSHCREFFCITSAFDIFKHLQRHQCGKDFGNAERK